MTSALDVKWRYLKPHGVRRTLPGTRPAGQVLVTSLVRHLRARETSSYCSFIVLSADLATATVNYKSPTDRTTCIVMPPAPNRGGGH